MLFAICKTARKINKKDHVGQQRMHFPKAAPMPQSRTQPLGAFAEIVVSLLFSSHKSVPMALLFHSMPDILDPRYNCSPAEPFVTFQNHSIGSFLSFLPLQLRLKMPSKIQLDENLWFLYVCLQKSDLKSVRSHCTTFPKSIHLANSPSLD